MSLGPYFHELVDQLYDGVPQDHRGGIARAIFNKAVCAILWFLPIPLMFVLYGLPSLLAGPWAGINAIWFWMWYPVIRSGMFWGPIFSAVIYMFWGVWQDWRRG